MLWVIIAANGAAMLIQLLSAKVGLATGRDLAAVCRTEFSRPVVLVPWSQAELVAMATDVAEVIGGAIALDLLHSGQMPRQSGGPDAATPRQLLRGTRWDVSIAMGLAGLVNVALLLVAAATFHGSTLPGLDTVAGAHAALADQLGRPPAVFFALALLASGLASSVGTYAGQVVIAGLLRRQLPLLLRRGITLAPALVVLALGADRPTRWCSRRCCCRWVSCSRWCPGTRHPAARRDGGAGQPPLHDRCRRAGRRGDRVHQRFPGVRALT